MFFLQMRVQNETEKEKLLKRLNCRSQLEFDPLEALYFKFRTFFQINVQAFLPVGTHILMSFFKLRKNNPALEDDGAFHKIFK